MLSQLETSNFGISGTITLETDLAFQRYRVLTSIGRGGMSEVFLAGWEHATGMHRLAVMKRLNAELCSDAVAVQMFLDEARIGLRLNHPNIVQTHDVGRFEGRLCILMEYLKGEPLHRVMHRLVERGEALPLELAVKIVVDALEGLAAAHDACDYDGTPLEIVHRDISPHNLFVEYDGRVKVLDFGIATAVIREGETRAGLVKGKFAYMAPEQARCEAVDRRADVWSVGVVFWELLTGSRLFKGATEAELLQATLNGPIPFPAAYRSDVPPVLEQVVLRALERDPARRYTSALEMKLALEGWLEAQGRGFNAALARFMNEAFGPERDEQRHFMRDLLSRREPSPTPSASVERLTALGLGNRTQLADPAELMRQQTQTNQLLQVLHRKNRIATWTLIGLLALLLGLALGVAIVLFRPPPPPIAELPQPLLGPRTRVEAEPLPQAPLPPVEVSEPPSVSEAVRATFPPLAPAPRTPVRSPRPLRAQRTAVELADEALSTAAAGAAGAGPGFLTLDTSPWSVVSFAGRVLGSTPLVRVPLPAGDVVLSLSNPETGAHASYPVRIEAGKTLARRIALE